MMRLILGSSDSLQKWNAQRINECKVVRWEAYLHYISISLRISSQHCELFIDLYTSSVGVLGVACLFVSVFSCAPLIQFLVEFGFGRELGSMDKGKVWIGNDSRQTFGHANVD